MVGRLRMGWFRFMRCISWSTSGMGPVHRQDWTKQGRQAEHALCSSACQHAHALYEGHGQVRSQHG